MLEYQPCQITAAFLPYIVLGTRTAVMITGINNLPNGNVHRTKFIILVSLKLGMRLAMDSSRHLTTFWAGPS